MSDWETNRNVIEAGERRRLKSRRGEKKTEIVAFYVISTHRAPKTGGAGGWICCGSGDGGVKNTSLYLFHIPPIIATLFLESLYSHSAKSPIDRPRYNLYFRSALQCFSGYRSDTIIQIFFLLDFFFQPSFPFLLLDLSELLSGLLSVFISSPCNSIILFIKVFSSSFISLFCLRFLTSAAGIINSRMRWMKNDFTECRIRMAAAQQSIDRFSAVFSSSWELTSQPKARFVLNIILRKPVPLRIL